jgi:DNA primase catalytic core
MSTEIKEEIKSKLDIVDLIGETVSLKKKGGVYRGATSSSSKSGSSLIVDPKKQVYNNFPEEDGGDIFNWIAWKEGYDVNTEFPQILEIAAEKAGVDLPQRGGPIASEKGEVYPFLRAVAHYYHYQLTDEHREYIHEKWGISDETIDELLIGYASGEGDMIAEMLDIFPTETIEKSGMVYTGSKMKEVFKNRIMFPYWKNGKVVYFAGRDPDWTSECNWGKYLKQPVHSEERPYISKCIDNSVLYGEDSSRKHDYCIITEGVTDCIMAIQAGLPCISPVTTRIKETQKEYAYEIVKNKSRVIICNDNEEGEAGKEGACATAEYLESNGVPVDIVELPRDNGIDKIDLAEYLQKYTPEDFERLPANNIWEIKLQTQNVPSKSIDKVRAVRDFISNDLRNMDQTLLEVFVKNEVREHFGMSKTEITSILKNASKNSGVGGFFDQFGKLMVRRLGDYVMQKHRFVTFEDTREVMVYRNGVYVPNGENVIAKVVQDALGDYSKKHHIAEIVNYIQIETSVPRSAINHDTTKINVKNGLYNLETGELEPHSPDFISIVQIPVYYDPDADCPRIKNFFEDVLRPEHIQVMCEFIGYSMIPDTRLEKAMMLLGKGANGKSVLLSLLGEFIGEDNTSHESLHGLENDPYSVAELYGKLLNIFPDLASSTIYENKSFKMLTGDEGKIRARKIYREPFSFKNTARLIFSANHLPPVPGDNFAYFRRWILLEFPNTFEGKDADKNLIDKLTTQEELSGLFNLAVRALRKLLENGEYSYDLSTTEVQRMYRINSDPIAAFADECVVYSESDCLKITMLECYNRWCG